MRWARGRKAQQRGARLGGRGAGQPRRQQRRQRVLLVVAADQAGWVRGIALERAARQADGAGASGSSQPAPSPVWSSVRVTENPTRRLRIPSLAATASGSSTLTTAKSAAVCAANTRALAAA